MEKKPNKKEELTLVNNVLKLATKLLKVRKKIESSILHLSDRLSDQSSAEKQKLVFFSNLQILFPMLFCKFCAATKRILQMDSH